MSLRKPGSTSPNFPENRYSDETHSEYEHSDEFSRTIDLLGNTKMGGTGAIRPQATFSEAGGQGNLAPINHLNPPVDPRNPFIATM